MKRFAVILFFLVSFQLSKGQGYISFPDSNAIWMVNWGNNSCFFPPIFNYSDYQYTISGDTVISTISYHKLARTGEINFCSDPLQNYVNNNIPIGCYRNDTLAKKVLYVPRDSINEVLLYDFNLIVGDTIHGYLDDLAKQKYGSQFYAKIDSIDSVLINSEYRLRWWYSMYLGVSPHGDNGQIIEGIGCTNGLLEGFLSEFQDNGILYCHSVNNVPLYPIQNPSPCIPVFVDEIPKSNQIDLQPNPLHYTVGVELLVISKVLIDRVYIVDLSGKVVLKDLDVLSKRKYIDCSSLQTGLYLVNVHTSDGQVIINKLIIQ